VTVATSDRDALLAALVELRATLDGIGGELRHLHAMTDRPLQQRAEGAAWHSILAAEDHPRLTDVLNRLAANVTDINARYRTALATSLYKEGLTMQGIAEVLGVTRQRVAALLTSPQE
jgi:DNA-directed RNA polymerase specialized sigma subunit